VVGFIAVGVAFFRYAWTTLHYFTESCVVWHVILEEAVGSQLSKHVETKECLDK